MGILEPIKAEILAIRIIPNVSPDLAASLNLRPDQKSIGMFTCTIDDVGYTAIDEATKKAQVEVVYAKSFYAGAAHASGPLSGEFIGIIAGPNPAEVKAGIQAAQLMIQEEAFFYTANEEGTIVFYAQTISRTGSYLSKVAGIKEGDALAYLIAPPLESVFGVDAALKAADVRMAVWFGPPSETNFGGGLLTGSQSACKAATEAFRDAVLAVARNPKTF
ncbi:ethanolamine utilization microcompartment protein EutL [Carboxydothermus ferrireducens]|uniref:Ethanolamine utilization protein EutL n=1 Tax=Carboxydothermus ferrireducens DSM 11255 TaxID=1119529 RepID=A0ABX2RBE0_9THEO|nr:ethanolamine utilization microcompartment protein EutL [Carboxydothermus ferrireducens]NYE58486.1 ethanolamine utilization protein EutL [Carboxydothermus ferrireducens DSM 11255]